MMIDYSIKPTDEQINAAGFPVFVYGTLKSGHGNHWRLENADLIGHGATVETFNMFCVGFPLITEGNGARVFGEVYRVSSYELAELDLLEGNGQMYQRQLREIELELEGGKHVVRKCWIYIWHARGHRGEAVEPYGNNETEKLYVWPR